MGAVREWWVQRGGGGCSENVVGAAGGGGCNEGVVGAARMWWAERGGGGCSENVVGRARMSWAERGGGRYLRIQWLSLSVIYRYLAGWVRVRG